VEYGDAWELQKALLEARISDTIEDCLVLLQHPPTFTYGRRYKEGALISNRDYYEKNGFAVYKTDRGGLATYHGPGQAVGYSVIKMSAYTGDYYQYLRMLEEVMIRTLSGFDIEAERREGYTGVWVNGEKIGFIGVRMALGYTMHGFSLNVNNDTSPFRLITPCGIQGIRVASLQTVAKKNVSVKAVYREITKCYSDVFQVQMTAIGIKAMMQRLGVINNMVKV
jgi:lipoate-protein ligase B